MNDQAFDRWWAEYTRMTSTIADPNSEHAARDGYFVGHRAALHERQQLYATLARVEEEVRALAATLRATVNLTP